MHAIDTLYSGIANGEYYILGLVVQLLFAGGSFLLERTRITASEKTLAGKPMVSLGLVQHLALAKYSNTASCYYRACSSALSLATAFFCALLFINDPISSWTPLLAIAGLVACFVGFHAYTFGLSAAYSKITFIVLQLCMGLVSAAAFLVSAFALTTPSLFLKIGVSVVAIATICTMPLWLIRLIRCYRNHVFKVVLGASNRTTNLARRSLVAPMAEKPTRARNIATVRRILGLLTMATTCFALFLAIAPPILNVKAVESPEDGKLLSKNFLGGYTLEQVITEEGKVQSETTYQRSWQPFLAGITIEETINGSSTEKTYYLRLPLSIRAEKSNSSGLLVETTYFDLSRKVSSSESYTYDQGSIVERRMKKYEHGLLASATTVDSQGNLIQSIETVPREGYPPEEFGTPFAAYKTTNWNDGCATLEEYISLQDDPEASYLIITREANSLSILSQTTLSPENQILRSTQFLDGKKAIEQIYDETGSAVIEETRFDLSTGLVAERTFRDSVTKQITSVEYYNKKGNLTEKEVFEYNQTIKCTYNNKGELVRQIKIVDEPPQ